MLTKKSTEQICQVLQLFMDSTWYLLLYNNGFQNAIGEIGKTNNSLVRIVKIWTPIRQKQTRFQISVCLK